MPLVKTLRSNVWKSVVSPDVIAEGMAALKEQVEGGGGGGGGSSDISGGRWAAGYSPGKHDRM